MQGNIDKKADAATTYSKTEVDDLVNVKANAADVYTKTEIDTKVTTINNAISAEETRAKGVEEELRTAIANAASGATTEVAKAADATHITVTENEGANGQKVYIIGESDIASAQALTDEIGRATAAEQGLDSAINGVSEKVTKLIGDDTDKSVRAIAAEEVAAQLIPENAGESLDTLQEIAAWIQAHPNDASAMNAAISQNATDIANEKTAREAADSEHAADIKALEEADAAQDALIGKKADQEALNTTNNAVALNTAAVADYKTRIEALELTSGKLDTTYVKVSDYNTDKEAFVQKHNDLQGEIDAAEGRLDTAEAAIANLKTGTGLGTSDKPTYTGANYISSANTMVEAELALDTAIKALDTRVKAEEEKTYVKSVSAGNDYVSIGGAALEPTISVNVTGEIAENNTGLVTGDKVFDALCWVEFE